VLALHPRLEFLGTLGAGLIAFDGEGRLMALNLRCTQLLQGLTVAPGTAFEDIFGTPFEHLLAQIHRGGELRLRDVLGSTLLGRCVNRPASRPVASRVDGNDDMAAAPGDADPVVTAAYARVEGALRLKATVLICGEPASGKSTLARYAHAVSGRRGALVHFPCADLPAARLEAEFLGHVGGPTRVPSADGPTGIIASADGGTIVFDAVDQLPPGLQVALLHFLDDRLIRAAGSVGARRIDVQVLATSATDLEEAVRTGRFRSDLLDSLGAVHVRLPPLRERRDFARLVQGALAALDPGAAIDGDAIESLLGHGLPGNFRELRAVLTRALLGHKSATLNREALEPYLAPRRAAPLSTLRRASVEIVRRELERCSGSISQTARLLGISRTTVYRYLEQGNEPGARTGCK
jgi:transcriptional regulator of acetoin/glycerol metabolism